MAVHQEPLGLFAPEDQGHPQRPVLIGQAADLAVLAFDRDQDRHIAGRVRLDELELGLSAAEHRRRGLQGALDVEAVHRLAAVRRHEGVVVPVLDQREIPPDISVDVRGGGFRGVPDEFAVLFAIDRAAGGRVLPSRPPGRLGPILLLWWC